MTTDGKKTNSIIDPTVELKNLQFQHYDETAKIFSSSVKPILGDDDDGNPLVLGSGILLSLDGAYFLVSAAHVFDQAKDLKIYIPCDDRPMPIKLNGFHTVAPNDDREKDKYDFALCNLTAEQATNLGVESFLNETLIATIKTSSDHHCMALGFPKSRNKVSVALKKIQGHLYRYITKSIRKEDDFSFFIYDNVLHAKDKDIIHDTEKHQYVKPVDPDGMSGGALIDVGPLSHWEDVIKAGHEKTTQGKLLGMIIEKKIIKVDGKYVTEIKAVDINLIRSVIRQIKANN